MPTHDNWQIQIGLKTRDGKFRDSYNAFGVKPMAEDAVDATDKREFPAAPGDAVYLSFNKV